MDESGVLMAPLARRTWAPKGETPVLEQRARKRQKVSIAGALWLPPSRDHLEWYFAALLDNYFNTQCVALFVEGLLKVIDAPLVLVWDGGTVHKGNPIRDLLTRHKGQLTLEWLPPYAPELSPVEPVWSWLKYGRLSNFAPREVRQLYHAVLREMDSLQDDHQLLRALFRASQLPLPRALLI